MAGVVIFMFMGLFGIIGLYIGVLMAREDPTSMDNDPVIRFMERESSRRKRKARLKEKYGFDDSYDKYIA